MALAAGARLGRYELLGLIGAGGMGEVYRARDTRLGRTVALKVLPPHLASDPARRERFEREARAASALEHPHICVLHDVGSESGVEFLVLELVEGETLAERLRRGRLGREEALRIATQVADALDAAHRKGVVHRDLKPGNVMLGRSGAKLLDFGLAHLREEPKGDEESTAWQLSGQGMVAGTVPYMSPEQLSGRKADARSDIWALGVVLYEMLTGRRPFDGGSTASLAAAILEHEPAVLSSLDPQAAPALEHVVGRCLAKDPDARWQTARDVANELAWISAGGTAVAPKAPAGRRRLWTVATLAVVVVAISAAIVTSRARRRPTAGAGAVPSVLALPCTVYGAPEVAYLADAFPGTISTLLGRIEGIDTKVPPSQLEVEKLGGDLARIADAFRVETLVLSSIVAQNADLLFNVQVVDAQSRRVLWSEQYKGALESYNELTRQAAEGIRRAIRPETSPVASTAGLAATSDAELAFRRGKYFFNRYNNSHEQADFDLALASLRRALELDPSLSQAAGQIAWLYVAGFESGTMPSRETVPAIEAWANRALAIDPCSIRGWSMLGVVEQQRPKQNTRKMVEYGLKAASCGPTDGHAQFFLGFGADVAGLNSVALAAYLESHRLDPLYVYAPLNAAIQLRVLGRPEEALRLADEALKIEPEMPILLLERALDLVELGRLAEAQNILKPLEAGAATDPLLGQLMPMVRSALALEEGDRAVADAAVGRVLAFVESPDATGLLVGIAAYYVAPALARHGRTREAVDIFECALRIGAPPPYEVLARNRDLASLGGDPRLPEIVARSRAQLDEALDVLEQARSRGELPAYLEEPLTALVRWLDEPGARIGSDARATDSRGR